MRADETNGRVRLLGFDGLGHFGVVLQRRRRGVNDDVIVALRLGETCLDVDIVRRAIHQLAIGNERSGLREPGRVPEGADFALGLVTSASATVESVKGWGA